MAPPWCDDLRLIDATPVPCGTSRETVQRSDLAGHAGYGCCAAHSRFYWGFKLYPFEWSVSRWLDGVGPARDSNLCTQRHIVAPLPLHLPRYKPGPTRASG